MVKYDPIDPANCEFIPVARVGELSIGERMFVEIDGDTIVVFNIAGGFFAIGDICSHDDGPLGDGTLEGNVIACPRHGATFDVRTGSVLSLPASVDIPSYPVRITGEDIEVGLPINA